MLNAFLGALTVAVSAVVVLSAAGIRNVAREPTDAHWSSTLPVLGGPHPPTHAWSRFHARYYPMSLVLIAFEMEMMFMYPWAVVYVEEGVTALVEMGVFLAVLSLGILYAWREGAFRWQ
jgi:NADH:ubiquinone oxidoreductase subunit 3 (subunit A)